MDLSIVIIFSNEEKQALLQCVKAVTDSDNLPSCEIILVNNGRQDISFIKEYLKSIYILDNQENLGIARARNQGVHMARAAILLFLDSDIIVQKNTISGMFDYLASHAEISGVSGKIVSPSGELHHNFGKLPSLIYPFLEIVNIPANKSYASVEGIYAFLGTGGLMFKKSAWDKISGYDEKFFYGFEDTDWCRRAYSSGLKLLYYPQVQSTHLLHQASKGYGRQVEFYLSEVYYYRKHYGYFWGSIIKAFIIGFSLLRLIFSFLKPRKRSNRDMIWMLVKKLIKR